MRSNFLALVTLCCLSIYAFNLNAQVKFKQEVHITDDVLFFDGKKVSAGAPNSTTGYDYIYGNSVSPRGDCIKTYKHFVFMTWYRGGKLDRHMMLTRYNRQTGVLKTIEFPHQHTGLNGVWWIGETHNTIGIGVSPKNGTIHMVFDMHAYGNAGKFVNDYFRYSYSVKNAAEVPDEDFTLDLFVKDPIDHDYKHCTMNGVRNVAEFSKYSYPNFFLSDQGDLFLTMRKGTSHDGAQAFIKYDDTQEKWGHFKLITALGAKAKGETHNWSIYGELKYTGGKLRIGFQRRLDNRQDKYQYQNGVYYAYSDDPTGATQWKNYKAESISIPLVKAEEALVYEPGDWVTTTLKDKVKISSGFDWTVTARGDVHIVSTVKDLEHNVTKSIHSYMPAGATEFTYTTEFGGSGALYTSGNDVYLIGLRGGRVYVDRVEGGTNNFENLYQQTTGKSFNGGSLYINEGFVYYYLKGNASGDTRPTYLQIYDLGITPADTTHELGFKNLLGGQEIALGTNLTVEAKVGSAFKEVSLWVDSTNVGTLTNAPYTWSSHALLTNMTAPFYQLKLVAIDSADVAIEKSVVIYTPEDLSRKISFNNLEDEDEIPYGSNLTIEATVGSAFKEVSLWLDDTNLGTLTSAPFTWSGHALLTNMVDPSYTFKLVAKDSSNVEVEEVVTLTLGEKELVVNPMPYSIVSVDAEQLPNVATNLFDGNTSDDFRWSARGYPKSVVIDLGAAKEIIGTRVFTYQSRAYKYKVELSDSPTDGFSQIVDRTNNTSDTQPISDDFLVQKGRYVKLTVTGADNYASDWISINELVLVYQEDASAIKSIDVNDTGVIVYPNPTNSGFRIMLKETDKAQIQIYRMTGQLVYNEIASDKTIELPKGIYLIKAVSSSHKVYHEKVIVR